MSCGRFGEFSSATDLRHIGFTASGQTTLCLKTLRIRCTIMVSSSAYNRGHVQDLMLSVCAGFVPSADGF